MSNLPQGIKNQSSTPAQAAQRSPKVSKDANAELDTSMVASATTAITQKLVAVAKTQIALEAAAMAYYESNFDEALLPPDRTLRTSVEAIAATIQQCKKAIYGNCYAAPDVIDVTALPIDTDASGLNVQSMALNFFAPSEQPRQLSGGN